MGAWGNEPFENDGAVDWLCKLETFITQTLDNDHSPKDESGIDERIAAIELVTMLELKPNFNEFGTCPLGFKFPNIRILDYCLKSIKEMRRQIKKKEYWSDEAPTKLLDKLQDKVEVIKNKLLMEQALQIPIKE